MMCLHVSDEAGQAELTCFFEGVRARAREAALASQIIKRLEREGLIEQCESGEDKNPGRASF